MGAGHDHARGQITAGAAHRWRLRIALCITVTVMAVEIAGGLLAGSLALLADAGHMATDALGLAMALLAIHFAGRPPSPHRTYGYARAEILAALANCLLLFGVGGYILYQAVLRLLAPTVTEGGLTLVFGAVGLAANTVSLALLRGGQRESLNVRGAFLEVAADALGSLAVLLSAGIVLSTGWQAADPIASLVIALMIVPRTYKLLRETLNVLLEAAPRDVDMAAVRAHILGLPGVEGLHDLHVWTITSGMPVLSAHVVVAPGALDAMGHERMLHALQGCLGEHFDVGHCTFQLEPGGHADHEAKLCH
ncbi:MULTISPECIES: cation diffusion facilitator family transporter [Streptomyces]|uniref:Cation transporter n=1 Tax=Streptomyces hygroscopicus TaxID=1912 RepID=A0ABQ3UA07_STRHY|nr:MULTISPECIES: cation diffusion facilitator family transporter [Streptomyces]MBW8091125.1 cation transporter [Streptomyces hygroscopicus subsp. hygroscopicus]MCO8305552.1 cation diffusion facilitator family transporter [Streptomyces sp. RKCA744]MDN3060185.1 cation diffusion facilitator family transporter [Streptomyces sp. SRF1]GHJ32435.1 cation transporter [Streptomyces hygroscopicus]GLV79518.1 cation transporter [Streptomyces hygroscopicus subsp. hygroscopicus]